MKRIGLITVYCLMAAWCCRADVRLPQIFGDHMVLQRGMPVPVWGWADPGEQVTVSFGGQTAATVAGADGTWRVRLDPMEASAQGRALTVAGNNTLTVGDVLVGEVWLLGGQSNMESDLSWCNPEHGRSANIPLLRVGKAQHTLAPRPQDDVEASWRVARDGQALHMTAAGFYFARKLVEELGVPVGLLDTSWGGSEIQFWVPLEQWKSKPELRERWEQEMATYRQNIAQYFQQVEDWLQEARAITEEGGVCARVPNMPWRREHGHMYNGMTHAFAPYAIRGMLWYQGEYNANDGDFYLHQMRGLIDGWRERWGQGRFPCYFVQLPNLDQPNDNPAGGDGWANIRAVQERAMRAIPGTGMIVTIDIGEADDIHPRNKLDVGERLARWALAREYGRTGLVYRSPFFKEMTVEDNRARIHFDSVGSGLMVGRKDGLDPAVEDEDGTLRRFAIAGEDRVWHWAEARIDGDTVVISSPAVATPVAVRYAYAMNPEGANLYNRDGLPAAPFRTDNW